jgi:hypothetical protein
MAMIRSIRPMDQVCILNTLVIQSFVLHIVIYPFNISFMFHKLPKIFSIHHIASDNNVFFELHPDFFFIKD